MFTDVAREPRLDAPMGTATLYLILIFREMKTPSVYIVIEPSDPHFVSSPL